MLLYIDDFILKKFQVLILYLEATSMLNTLQEIRTICDNTSKKGYSS